MFCWNVASDVGGRKYQEDRHHVVSDAHRGIVVAAVYDGHGNARVSTALADKEIGLAPALVAWAAEHGSFPESDGEAERLFHDVDKQIWSALEADDGKDESATSARRKKVESADSKQASKRSTATDKKGKQKARKNKKKLGSNNGGGSTAVVAAIDGKKVFLYNVGDSRALLLDADTGKVLLATKDHKPDRIDERARILSKGGDVKARHEVARATTRFTEWGYATSRAFGDFEMKRDFTETLLQAYTNDADTKRAGSSQPGQKKQGAETDVSSNIGKDEKENPIDHDGVMSVTPEVYSAVLDSSVPRHYVILASDGLWDVLESDDVAAIVGEWTSTRKSTQPEPKNDSLADLLLDESLQRGATDNVTVIVLEINNAADQDLLLSSNDRRQTICLQSMKSTIMDIMASLDRTDRLLAFD